MDQFGVRAGEKDELIGALAPMRIDIVEVESSATGTPLPDSYRNASPMTSEVPIG